MQTIKAERLRQGIKGKELARRLGVSAARVTVLERDEDRGAVTLTMIEKAAAALGCTLEYRLVPEQTASSADKPRVKLQFQSQDDSYTVQSE